MSEIKVNSVVNSTGDNDSGLDLATNDNIKFKIANAEKAVIDASGNVGIGDTSPSFKLSVNGNVGISQGSTLFFVNDSGFSPSISNSGTVTDMSFFTNNSERMRIDTSGNVLVAKTSANGSVAGHELRNGSFAIHTRDNGPPLGVRRIGSGANDTGQFVFFENDTADVGQMGHFNGGFYIGGDSSTNNVGVQFNGDNMIPTLANGTLSDNAKDIGHPSYRWDDIFATNGTIQTSDQNEKQDTASLTSKELNVAKKLSALFKTFRWKDKVAEKGDKARTHTGIIAQEVQSAFSAEGLDASKYGLFTSSTWWEKEIKVEAVKENKEKEIEAKDAYSYMDTKDEKTDGYTERTRLGVRYPELFSFIFSSIEARLTALEGK